MQAKATTLDIHSNFRIVDSVKVEVGITFKEAKTTWTIKRWELLIHMHTLTSIGIGRLETMRQLK